MPLKTLYGGAMSCELPESAVDISQLRQIPDNQEVFSHRSTDQSILIELMELDNAGSDDSAAIQSYRDDLASANESTIESFESLKLDPSSLSVSASSCLILKSLLPISKFKEQVTNSVQVLQAVIRLSQYRTDVLVTFYNPLCISSESSSHGADGSTSNEAWNEQDFINIVNSVKLHDPGLFGG